MSWFTSSSQEEEESVVPARREGSRTQWISIALFEGGSSKVSSSGLCLSSPSAQPGSPSEKEMDKDQCTGSDWQLYATLRCDC